MAVHEKAVQRWKKGRREPDELFAQLFSYNGAGFPLGASTFIPEKDVHLQEEARAKGLQARSRRDRAEIASRSRRDRMHCAPRRSRHISRVISSQVPHAYCVLALTTLADGEQLIKLRNPNGHAGWRGDWGAGSPRWTYDLKQARDGARA